MRTILLTSLTLSLLAAPVVAAPTTVTVRAVSRDAKVIGDGVGGARITIRNADTGVILATGVQKGNTGETKRIMQDPRGRGAVIYGTEGAAAFRATFDLQKPTRVEIFAEGPLLYPQALQRASKTMLLVPGQKIEGEGVILEIAGFIVDVLSPAEAKAGEPVPLRVKVTMTCGCPTEPGGMWNADNIAVTARVNGRETALKYAGVQSTYEASLPALPAGTYEIEILAVDRVTANVGRALQNVTVK